MKMPLLAVLLLLGCAVATPTPLPPTPTPTSTPIPTPTLDLFTTDTDVVRIVQAFAISQKSPDCRLLDDWATLAWYATYDHSTRTYRVFAQRGFKYVSWTYYEGTGAIVDNGGFDNKTFERIAGC